MGTRADFYVGRGEGAEWLGSIAWDGYPDGISNDIVTADSEATYRHHVERFFATRDDVTRPEQGWPWPWETSHTTDFAYAFASGLVYTSCFGRPWQEAAKYDHDKSEEAGPAPVFPDMCSRQNVQFGGKRSGLIVVSAPADPVAPRNKQHSEEG